MYIFRLLILASIILLASCGGGGGSSGSGAKTSITVNPGTLEFTTNVNSSSTARSVNVSFKGDGMIVGYPVGSVDPGWLTVDVSESYSSPVTVNVQAHAFGMPAGTHRTTLRFVTGKEDGSNIVYKDVPVTMIIEEGASIATESLSFTSLESVSGENKSFNISTKSASDWSLSVQYYGTETNWLTLSQSSGSLSTNGSTSVTVSTKGIKQGEHTASIMLRNKSGSIVDTLNVSYQVNSGITVENSISKTITEKTNVEDLQWSIPIQSLYDSTKGSTINWTLTSNKDWLKAVSLTGNLATSPILQLELDADKLLLLQNGAQLATLSLSFNDSQIKTKEISVNLQLNVNLQLTINPYPNFIITKDTTESELQKNYNIGLNGGTAFNKNFNWAVQIGHPLVKAVNSSGDLINQSSLTLKIDKDDLLAQNNAVIPTGMTISSTHTAIKPINIQFGISVELPQIDTVSPYVGFTNQSGPIVMSGSGFGRLSTLQINFDGQLVDATVVNSNTLRMTYPPVLNPKTIKLSTSNALNIDKSQASLIIKNPISYMHQKINVNREFWKIIQDSERESLILVGQSSNEIGRVSHNNGSWNYTAIPFQDAANAELSFDGKELLIPFSPLYFEIYTKLFHLDPVTLSIKSQVLVNDFERFGMIAPMYNKKILIASRSNSLIIDYPSLRFVDSYHRYDSDLLMSRDRSYVIFGETMDGEGTESYDGNQFTRRSIGRFDKRNTSMSTNADRIVIENKVYDRDFNLLGALTPDAVPYMSAVSPDGQYVYFAEYDGSFYRFKRANISAANGSYVSENWNIPLDTDQFPYSVTVSDDGKALFVLSKNFLSFDQNEAAILNIIPLNN